jgi:hypothetical protein
MAAPLNLDSSYKINDPDVIADSIHGETLIINLVNGVYYSSDGTGDEIWRRLQDGWRVGEVVDAIIGRHHGDAAAIREDVLAFIAELRADALIVESEPVAAQSIRAAVSGADDGAYAKPVLQRYTDYQELLLLDPIHEVLESAGWPVAKPDGNR